MNSDIKEALRDAVKATLNTLEALIHEDAETHLIWRRNQDGGWTGSHEQRPSLMYAFIRAHERLENPQPFSDLFRSQYPNYSGMVGTASTGLIQLQPSMIVQRIAAELWDRHSSLSLPDDVINGIVCEFENFIESPTVTISYVAPLGGFALSNGLEAVPITDGLSIKRLSEKEVSEIFGGRIDLLRGQSGFIHEIAFVGEFEEPKIVGGELTPSNAITDVTNTLRRAVIALTTFKGGRVVFTTLRFSSRRFCPLLFGSRSYGSTPEFGNYQLSAEEVEPLREHASYIFGTLHPSLEVACTRLADAQMRNQPQDSLIDAAIGLEAVLLATQGREEYRGEMRYRFSLNFSSLFELPDDRYKAFRRARAIYDLRSRIAHGGQINHSDIPIADERVNLAGAASLGSEMLRDLVKKFLRDGGEPPFTKEGFWEKRYFGLED